MTADSTSLVSVCEAIFASYLFYDGASVLDSSGFEAGGIMASLGLLCTGGGGLGRLPPGGGGTVLGLLNTGGVITGIGISTGLASSILVGGVCSNLTGETSGLLSYLCY